MSAQFCSCIVIFSALSISSPISCFAINPNLVVKLLVVVLEGYSLISVFNKLKTHLIKGAQCCRPIPRLLKLKYICRILSLNGFPLLSSLVCIKSSFSLLFYHFDFIISNSSSQVFYNAFGTIALCCLFMMFFLFNKSLTLCLNSTIVSCCLKCVEDCLLIFWLSRETYFDINFSLYFKFKGSCT